MPRTLTVLTPDGQEHNPTFYHFHSKGPGRTEETVQQIQQTMHTFRTNMNIVPPASSDLTFDQMAFLTKPLSQKQLLKLHGQASLTRDTRRTPFQWTLLKAYGDLRQLRLTASTPIAWSAFSSPIAVVPLEKLIGLDVAGKRLNETTGAIQAYALRDLFTRPMRV